jgi:hypothetical protein
MYIDPGAGSIVLQALAASVLAFVAGVRGTRESVRRALRRLLGRRAEGE